jgi:hypothetical protein
VTSTYSSESGSRRAPQADLFYRLNVVRWTCLPCASVGPTSPCSWNISSIATPISGLTMRLQSQRAGSRSPEQWCARVDPVTDPDPHALSIASHSTPGQSRRVRPGGAGRCAASRLAVADPLAPRPSAGPRRSQASLRRDALWQVDLRGPPYFSGGSASTLPCKWQAMTHGMRVDDPNPNCSEP